MGRCALAGLTRTGPPQTAPTMLALLQQQVHWEQYRSSTALMV